MHVSLTGDPHTLQVVREGESDEQFWGPNGVKPRFKKLKSS